MEFRFVLSASAFAGGELECCDVFLGDKPLGTEYDGWNDMSGEAVSKKTFCDVDGKPPNSSAVSKLS